MAYAFCLRLAPGAEASVAALWGNLGDDNSMLRLGYPPHLSLAVLDVEPPLAVVEAAFEAVRDTPSLALRLGGARQFPGTSIFWLSVNGGSALTHLHRKLLDRLPKDQVREHYRAGLWTPHVTLQMDGDETTLSVAQAAWREPVATQFLQLDLVQFPPVRVLKSAALS